MEQQFSSACNICCQQTKGQCNCNVTCYRSLEHKMIDLKIQNSSCTPFKVQVNDILGRHFVATCDLEPGDVVLHEAPLVTGPPFIRDRVVCVACYRVFESFKSNYIQCQRCGWTVCNQRCADSSVHQPECKLSSSTQNPQQINIRTLLSVYPVYQCLIILRCLLFRDSNPQIWHKLQQMEPHCAKRKLTGQYEQERKTVAPFLLDFLRLKEKNFTEDDVLKMCGVVQVNGYPVRLNEPYYMAVYDVASFIEHNCVPNCAKVFTERGELIIKAALPVSKGEHLSTSYTDPQYGTQPRRQQLKAELLACRCQRCCDPTELQTYYSALRCKNSSCKGYVLPRHVLSEDINNNNGLYMDAWQCSECDIIVPSKEVHCLLEEVTHTASIVDKSDIQACEFFLKSHRVYLHENHYLLLPIRIAVASRSLAGITDSELEETCCSLKHLLHLTDLILPAENRMRGMLLFHLHTALLEREIRKVRSASITPDELSSHLEEPKQLLQMAVDVLCDQPEIVKEGRMARLVKEKLLSFDSIAETVKQSFPQENTPLKHSLGSDTTAIKFPTLAN